MRNVSVLFVGSVICCFAPISSSSACAQEKKQTRLSIADIDSLIKELGSQTPMVRGNATNRLLKAPDALAHLRRKAAGQDLETRRRMEVVIEKLARERFHERLAELAKQKGDAPVDLLMDLLLENRADVDEAQWKLAFETVSAIAGKLTKNTKLNGPIPDPRFDLRACQRMVGTEFKFNRSGPMCVLGDRLSHFQGLGFSFAVVTEPVQTGSIIGCILLTRGSKKPQFSHGFVLSSFVYCDDDFLGDESLTTNVVITRGTVKFKDQADNVIIEKAGQSTKVRLFSAIEVGFGLENTAKGVRIEKIAPGSRAEKCGFKAGDVILIEKSTNDLDQTERILRRSYAKEVDLELDIERQGRRQKQVLTFVD